MVRKYPRHFLGRNDGPKKVSLGIREGDGISGRSKKDRKRALVWGGRWSIALWQQRLTANKTVFEAILLPVNTAGIPTSWKIPLWESSRDSV